MVENENRNGWSQLLGMLVCLAWLFPPTLNVAIGQEGTFIQLNPPAEGAPPTPGRASTLGQASTESIVAEISSEDLGEAELESVIEENASSAENLVQENAEGVGQVELSVEPGSQPLLPGSRPLLPENRPAWVGADPDYSGKNHRLFVGSLPMAKQSEADRGLDEPMMAAFNAYLDDHLLGDSEASQHLALGDDFIRRNLINDPIGFMAEITTSQGPMYQKWVTLEITPAQQKQIKKMHQEAVQLQRIKPIAIGLAGLLGLVGLMHISTKRKKGVASVTPLDREQLAAMDRPSQHMPQPRKRSSGFGLLVLAGLFLLPFAFLAMFLVAPVVSYQEMPPSPPIEIVQPVPPAVPAPSAEALLNTLQNNDEKVIIHKSENGQSITITTRY